MQAGRKYTLWQTVLWSRKSIFIFSLYHSAIVALFYFLKLDWLFIPWQPISIIGIAVAFYLGFKNNSSYDRLWEARKIWGGIVNASRSFSVMGRDFVNNDETKDKRDNNELNAIRKSIVHRHVAWLHALTYQLRKLKAWEHVTKEDKETRERLGTTYTEKWFENLKTYLSKEDYNYMMSKGNKASHLLSIQSKHLIKLRQEGVIEHFRHLAMQNLITEFYTLEGKAERIKNFPFPRQYASANNFFASIFIVLLPFGMLNIFSAAEDSWMVWLVVPFAVICSWVFWTMELIGDYSENPFEGLHNDVPISAMATGIEIDIRQMLDEVDLPTAKAPDGEMQILM